MLTQIAIHAVTVLDQDEALDFYVGKLGFEVGDDVDMGFMRWLTITLPAVPDRHILLEVPSEDEDGARVRELLTKGALGVAAIINTDDCRATYDTLRSRGVTFTEEPTQQPYGIDCALRDPFGNHLRITEPTPMQEITEEDLRRWRGEE